MSVESGGLLITASNDTRITGIGRFLRQWKLDELPELYNVVIGDMSFVGPRPEVPEWVNLLEPEWEIVLSVRPGITDPVTLKLRNEEDLLAGVQDKEALYRDVIQPFKLAGYIKYLRVRSFKSDVKIMLRTAKAILVPKSEMRTLETANLTPTDETLELTI